MKKFVKVVCLFLVCSNFCIFSVEKSENANKKTAIRCMDLAESCIYSENFEDAIKNVNMGLQYDDSISDLYYLKASAFVKMDRTKNEILQEIKIAFDKNNWIGYNKDGARILYADLLCDTAEHEKSLEILDEESDLDDTENSELTGFVDQFDDEEQHDK
jgi:tetratricopeptide (TPR) repeat protein